MKKIFIIAKYTFLEFVKSKILLNTFFIGIGIILSSFIASEFTYGVPGRVALDLGLGMLSISSIIIAIFLGVNLVSKEIENRTVYMVLSRSTSRTSFLLGKSLGLTGILAVNVFILGVFTVLVAYFLGGTLSPLIFWCILFSTIEAIIIMYIVVNFSLVTNQIMSVIYSIALLISSYALSGAKEIFYAKIRKSLTIILNIFEFILPDLNKLNLKELVLYQPNVELSYLLKTTTYSLFYITALILLACFLFNRKSLT